MFHTVVVVALTDGPSVHFEPYFHARVNGSLFGGFNREHEPVDYGAARSALRGERSHVHYSLIAVADRVIGQSAYHFGNSEGILGFGTRSVRVRLQRGDEGGHRRFHRGSGSVLVHDVINVCAVCSGSYRSAAAVHELVVERGVELRAYRAHSSLVVSRVGRSIVSVLREYLGRRSREQLLVAYRNESGGNGGIDELDDERHGVVADYIATVRGKQGL